MSEAPPEWRDLADNRAGAAARAQAERLKDAAPFRSAVARLLGVHSDERAWRIGADGEEKVAAKLDKVSRKDPRWRSLHAIPVGQRGSDIDHLVIGPGGVFTVNAKHHPRAKIWVGGDTFLVNGQRHPYIRNCRHEASRAARLLAAAGAPAVPVRGVIVPVRADKVSIKKAPDDVEIIARFELARWLLRCAPTLDNATIAAVYEVARRSTTWLTRRLRDY
jgi:hypothetical protein